MATMQEIEVKTKRYADARLELSTVVTNLTDQITQLRMAHIKVIRQRVAVALDAQSELQALVKESPTLFEKPKTRTMHGIKVGFQKGKGKVTISDEAATIKRIRAGLPKDQAELLIRVEESVHRPAVYDLAAADLKRLGIEITDAGDHVVVKDVAGEVDKLVEALLKESGEVDA